MPDKYQITVTVTSPDGKQVEIDSHVGYGGEAPLTKPLNIDKAARAGAQATSASLTTQWKTQAK